MQAARRALVYRGQDREAHAALDREIEATARELEQHRKCKSPGPDARTRAAECVIRIQVVAHSMGALVANELLQRNPDLYFSDVVYMAAASSNPQAETKTADSCRACRRNDFSTVPSDDSTSSRYTK